ncbi:MAG: cupin domain-containing protein [Acidiferrobacterales bacterium]
MKTGTCHTQTLITKEGETSLSPEMCADFRAGSGNTHQFVVRTEREAFYLEVGDRSAGVPASYPDDDPQAMRDNDGQ